MKNLIPQLSVCLLALAWMRPLPTAEQSYEVRGRMESTFQRPDDPAPQTNSRNFMLVTDGSNVFIRCNMGVGDKGFEYTEFGTDGTNGFSFDKSRDRPKTSTGRGSINNATMSIEASPEPVQAFPPIRHIWRSYVTQRGLRTKNERFVRPDEPGHGNGIPVERELLRILMRHMELRAEWVIDDQPPHLLQKLVDFQDASFNTRRYSSSLIPDEFMTGFTNSRLDVLSWTNIAGLHLPIETRVVTYYAKTNNPGSPLHPLSTYRLLTTNILTKTIRTNFVPPLASATRIVDHRFEEEHDQVLMYIATNGIILSTFEEGWKEVQRQDEKERRRREERERAKALELLPKNVPPAK